MTIGGANNKEWEFRVTKDFKPDMNVAGNFKILQKTHSLENMILLNADGVPTKYTTAEDILYEWCAIRIDLYDKRRIWWIKKWKRDLERYRNKYQFIELVRKGPGKGLDMRQTKKEIEADMLAHKLKKLLPEKDAQALERLDAGTTKDSSKASFDYLLSMAMSSMTEENQLALKKLIKKAKAAIAVYEEATPQDLWEEDLKTFESAYAKFLKTRSD